MHRSTDPVFAPGAHEQPKTSDGYEQPIVTVDPVIFTLKDKRLHVLLGRRKKNPCAGREALPGVWIHTNEDHDLEDAVRRGLKDKTGVEAPYFEQVHSFGSVNRDTRRWSVSISYMALLPWETVQNAQAGRDLLDLRWAPVDDLNLAVPHDGDDLSQFLAFDHGAIIRKALERLRNKVNYSSLPAHLLPKRFTKTQLQEVYEAVLGVRLDKSAFRKKLDEADFLVETSEAQKGRHRPAALYELRRDALVMFRRTLTEG